MSNIREHVFTEKIRAILKEKFADDAEAIFEKSPLLWYLNTKTKSASAGSKARGSFANLYALFVLIEDYINKGYSSEDAGNYNEYEGANFSDLLRRQRELPFGSKLQNHALNSRLNGEFKKFFPTLDKEPIIRDLGKQRYWIHEELLLVSGRSEQVYNIAVAVTEIINAYIASKREAFELFISTCKELAALPNSDDPAVLKFIEAQLRPEVDARIFEIVSFGILKAFYSDIQVFWGWSREAINPENLTLYKTGRTNANDGGIDFVMKPLGRFFQVTETIDVNKYFLDLDKIQRFPLTFVIKSNVSLDELRQGLESKAVEKYQIKTVVEGYMKAIEELINIPKLLECLGAVIQKGKLREMMQEIEVQSRVEFNYTDIVQEEV